MTPGTSDSIAVTVLTAAIGMFSAVVTAVITSWANQKKSKAELKQAELNYEAQLKALETDDSTKLRHDLLEERKILLQQLLEERNYYVGKMQALETRVQMLEDENRKKDSTILEQAGKLQEQSLEIHAQRELIQVLQNEVDQLKAGSE